MFVSPGPPFASGVSLVSAFTSITCISTSVVVVSLLVVALFSSAVSLLPHGKLLLAPFGSLLAGALPSHFWNCACIIAALNVLLRLK